MWPAVSTGSRRFLARTIIPDAKHLLFIGFCLLLSIIDYGCGLFRKDPVRVKLVVAGSPMVGRLDNVSVIVGGDKLFWHTLEAGTVETMTFAPGEKDDRQLTLFYTVNSQAKIWEGPKVALGKGYRIEIRVHSNGEATHRYCLLPCNLD